VVVVVEGRPRLRRREKRVVKGRAVALDVCRLPAIRLGRAGPGRRGGGWPHRGLVVRDREINKEKKNRELEKSKRSTGQAASRRESRGSELVFCTMFLCSPFGVTHEFRPNRLLSPTVTPASFLWAISATVVLTPCFRGGGGVDYRAERFRGCVQGRVPLWCDVFLVEADKTALFRVVSWVS